MQLLVPKISHCNLTSTKIVNQRTQKTDQVFLPPSILNGQTRRRVCVFLSPFRRDQGPIESIACLAASYTAIRQSAQRHIEKPHKYEGIPSRRLRTRLDCEGNKDLSVNFFKLLSFPISSEIDVTNTDDWERRRINAA